VNALQGKIVVVTRPLPDAKSLADLLRHHGAEPLVLPMIDIRALDDPRPLDALLQKRYDWAIFTSANAVRQVWERLAVLNIAPQMDRVAAVGVKTAAELSRHGITASIIPDDHSAEGLFRAMDGHLKKQRILLPQADRARPILAQILREAGAQVEAVTAYHTVFAAVDTNLMAAHFDAITFTSASTVSSFVTQIDDPLTHIGGALVACIGPVTASAVQENGLPVHVIAHPHTAEGLVKGLSAAFERMLTP
jgi:uroporphyrinogen-III synthase